MNNHVQIAIRWRAAMQNREVCIEKVDKNIVCIGPPFRTFLFDHVFDSAADSDPQAEVYNVLMGPLIERAFQGYDCTFLAYGQTGSGKTYTVGFDQSVNSEQHNGMTARVLKSIFSFRHAEQVKVLISFIEVYNDQAFDLLAENQQEPFYNKENRLALPTRTSIKSNDDVLSILGEASKRRHVRNTKMNSVSSRSHAVFTIYLGIKHAEMDIRESVINIVDLAGSEGFGKAGNIMGSEAHIEGKFINESLAAFKRVINAMACGQKHIPYRDSTITTLLKNALNSQSYLTLLGCVSPYKDDCGETLSTIRFVSEAKQIQRTPQLNAIISDFQQSKTPVNVNTLSRRPASMPTGLPNKRSYPISKVIGLPPKKLTFTTNSSEFHRFERCSVPSNSTTKKTMAFNRQRQFDSLTGNRSKAVTNLFPMPLTPSRRLIENLLNKKADESNGSINFCDASTSSALAFSDLNVHRLSSPSLSSNEIIQSHVGKIANLLAGPALQMVLSEMEKRVAENSDPKLRPNQIIESFHAVLNKLLSQDIVKESLATKNPIELSPLVEKSDESGMAVASTSKEAERITNEDSVFTPAKLPSSSIAIDVNHAEKQILVEVLASPIDTLTSTVPFLTPSASAATLWDFKKTPNQSELYALLESPLDCRKSTADTDKLEQTASKDEVDDTINKSYEMPINDSMMVQLTPITVKSSLIETNRTTIAKIQLRTKMDLINESAADMIDDNSAYEIVMVNKDRISPAKKVRFTSNERTTMGSNEGDADNASGTKDVSTAFVAYPLLGSNEMASKKTARDHRFPIAPNAILQRINVLQEYNRSITMQNAARLAAEHWRMSQQSKRLAKGVPPVPKSRSALITKNILDILNSGTQKDLTLLATIGPKTAAVIFQNREERGRFECIDALLRVPQWSRKKHRRFLELNIHC